MYKHQISVNYLIYGGEELRKYRDHFEELVEKRTAELSVVNEQLQKQNAERKLLEESLRELEEKYYCLVQSTEDSIYLVDRNCRYILMNKKHLSRLGLPIDKIIGRTYGDFHSVKEEKEFAKKVRKVFETGKSVQHEHGSHRDGGYFLRTLSPVKEKDGRTRAVTVISKEITSRKRAEEEVKKLSSAVEQSFDGIAISDLELKLTYVNDAFARLHGYSIEEMIGMKVAFLHNDEQMDEHKIRMNEIKTQGLWTGEIERMRKDGTRFSAYMSYNLLKDDEGNPTGILAVVRDITDQKSIEAQFHRAQKMEAIGILAGGIAHNFNNLLMGIQGNASLILLDIDSDHPAHEKLNNIEKMVNSGSKLTNQLLGYAMGGRYEVKTVSLNQVVKDTSDTFGTTRKETTIHQELAQDLSRIIADQGQIEQVLLNLYLNAVDVMPEGGDLFLKTMNVAHRDMNRKPYKVKLGNYVLLTVRDTGVGMDKETMERIFEPFFTTKGLAKGTGLGLASTYGIIKAHGGYIDVESKKGHAHPPRLSRTTRDDGGRGTTFYIYLPASEEKEVIGIKKLPEEGSKGKETVLLVDDEDMILDVGHELLKTLGYKVLIAKGGKEALGIYKKNKDTIDIVILDMIMPDMGGGETYDRMKKIKPNIKVLLSSGYSIKGRATEMLERGCDGFIQKPFSMKELSARISEILKK